MDELDYLLKNAIKDEFIPSEEDINSNFVKFKADLVNTDNKKYYLGRLNYMNFKKTVVISMCCLMCLTTILLSSSSTVRAAAMGAIDSIKSIFVVEGWGNDIKIVRKPVTEIKSPVSVFSITSLNDSEIEKLIGYKVLFPENLSDNFKLANRCITLSLKTDISYNSAPEVKSQMEKAIYNQKEFKNLSVYSPYRAISSYYKCNEPKGFNLIINCWPIPTGVENYSDKEEVKVGNSKGYWLNINYPEYPQSNVNGNLQSDLTTPPTIKNDCYMLSWSKNKLYYSIYIFEKSNPLRISKEEAIKIAEEFQAAQPN